MANDTAFELALENAAKAGRCRGHLEYFARYFDDLYHPNSEVRAVTRDVFVTILEEFGYERKK